MDVTFSGLHMRQHCDRSIYPRICSLLRQSTDILYISTAITKDFQLW